MMDAQVTSLLWNLVSPKEENKKDGQDELSISSQFWHLRLSSGQNKQKNPSRKLCKKVMDTTQNN